MASMKRGVGYCENTDCEDYAKGVFLLNHGDTFYCPRCRQLGKVEKERGFYTGNSDIFKEVRVEYNFDPINGVYREIAIVRDESLWGRNNVYTLQSPLIKTEKRALKVAEAILANLNRYRGLLERRRDPAHHRDHPLLRRPLRRVPAQGAAARQGARAERPARTGRQPCPEVDSRALSGARVKRPRPEIRRSRAGVSHSGVPREAGFSRPGRR